MLQKILLSLLLSAFTFSSQANEKVFGDYIVYYSIFTSDFLQPEIAKLHNITRSHDRILLNVTVMKKEPGKNKRFNKPSKAKITGSANDLIHTHFINFKPIVEPNALYYIGEFKSPGRQMYIVDLDIQPEDSKQIFNLRFHHEVFATKDD